jgi:hypothetical protein
MLYSLFFSRFCFHSVITVMAAFTSASVLFSLIAWTISFSGCGYQLYQISEQYFRYDTATQVTIERREILFPPKVIICGLRSDYRIKGDDGERLTEQQIVADLTDQPVFSAETVISENTQRLVVFVTEDFTRQNLVCSSYEFPDIAGVHLNEVMAAQRLSPDLLELTLKARSNMLLLSRQWYVYTIPAESKFYGTMQSFVVLLSKSESNQLGMISHDNSSDVSIPTHIKFHSLRIGYSYFKAEFLSYPFKTDCVDYFNHYRLESQAHCFDSCITKATIMQTNGWIHYTSLPR